MLTVSYPSAICQNPSTQQCVKGMRTLSRPGHLLVLIHLWHGSSDLEPHIATCIPALDITSTRHLGKIVLRWSRVVDLLRRDVVDGGASRYLSDGGGFCGCVAADIGTGRTRDSLFRVGVFGLAC
jgi:hypothetical protein